MKPVILVVLSVFFLAAAQPARAQSKTGGSKGRIAVLERLDQNISKAVDGVNLTDKHKASLDKDRQVLRQAASARREGLNEDRKATEKALEGIDKVFKDKKLAVDESSRQTVREDVNKLLADSRNQPKQRNPRQNFPNPRNPYPRNPRVPRW